MFVTTVLFLRIAILIILTIIAVITDLKTGHIPNSITYSMIVIGLAINIITNYYILYCIIGAIVLYIIGLVTTSKGLGGGDIKLFIGIFLLLPMYKDIVFVLFVMVISTIMSYVYMKIYKKNFVKFAPFILVAEIILLVI